MKRGVSNDCMMLIFPGTNILMHLLVTVRKALTTASADVWFCPGMDVHVVHEFGSGHKHHPATIEGAYVDRCFCRRACANCGNMC